MGKFLHQCETTPKFGTGTTQCICQVTWPSQCTLSFQFICVLNRVLDTANDKPVYDSKLDKKLEKLREEGKRYTKAFGQGILTESQFKEQMTSVNSEIRQIKAVIEESKQTHRPATTPFSMPDLNTLCGKMKTGLSNASPEDKQFIIRHIVETIVASQNEAVVSGIIPLEFTQNTRNIAYESNHRHRRAP